jgi:hypothetical protein
MTALQRPRLVWPKPVQLVFKPNAKWSLKDSDVVRKKELILLVRWTAFPRLSQLKHAVHPGQFDEVLLHKSVDDLLERWRQVRHSHTWLPWAQQGRMQLIILDLHWLATHSHIRKVQRASRGHGVNDTQDSRFCSDPQIQQSTIHMLIQNGCRQCWSRTCMNMWKEKRGITWRKYERYWKVHQGRIAIWWCMRFRRSLTRIGSLGEGEKTLPTAESFYIAEN